MSRSWHGSAAILSPLLDGAIGSVDYTVGEATDEPTGWTDAAFDDSAWTAASTYGETEVGTKDGYDTIAWSPAAALIWTADLQVDNTILWRFAAAG